MSSKLKTYGLDGKETDVFLTLVEKNQLTAYQIAKHAKLHKSTVYDVLTRLKQKGFVTQETIDKVATWKCNDVSSIIGQLQSKESLLESMVPELIALQNQSIIETKILMGEIGQKQFNHELMYLVKKGKLTELMIIGNKPPK